MAGIQDRNQKELQFTGFGAADVRTAFVLPGLDPGQSVNAFSLYWNSQVYADTNRVCLAARASTNNAAEVRLDNIVAVTGVTPVEGATWGAQRFITRVFLIDSPVACTSYGLAVATNRGDASKQLADMRLCEASVIQIDSDLRAQPVTNGQADGIGFVLPRAADYGATRSGIAFGNEEPNLASATGPNCGVGFDIDNNGTAEEGGDNNHVSLPYGSYLARTNPGFDFSNARFHHSHVRIAFRADGSGADMSIKMQENGLGMEAVPSRVPVSVFANYFIAGFSAYDCRLQFATRTGCATSIQQLDNTYALCGSRGLAHGGDFRGAVADDARRRLGRFQLQRGSVRHPLCGSVQCAHRLCSGRSGRVPG